MIEELSVVTGSWNRIGYLIEMVNSVRRSMAYGVPYRVYVVDGGSEDGTQSWCKKQKDIHLIEQGELLGAIKAFNAGAAAAKGNFVVLANDDITFLGDSLARALAFMQTHPDCGCGCFYQDRGQRDFHVAQMPAHTADGRMTSADYGQVAIYPRWLGEKCGWWGNFGARTYGGDNYLSAKIWEAGYKVLPITGAKIHDCIPNDDLRIANGNHKEDSTHPDTLAYQRQYPRGPLMGVQRKEWSNPLSEPMRILYAPIYEPNHVVQHAQKRGLRAALQRKGLVWEIDYVAGQDIYAAADSWKPHLVITQLHDANLFGPWKADMLREILPQSKLVNWNGDVYARGGNERYIDVLRNFDLQCVVNADDIPTYRAAGIRAAYWQIGWEPDGVGHDPDPDTFHHDIVFLATGYSPARHELGEFLRSTKYSVGIYGTSWPQGWASGDCLYDFVKGCKLYQAAKIAIGDDQYGATGFVSNRFFQAMAAGGSLLLHKYVPGVDGLLGLRDGSHYVSWRTHEDLLRKIDYYLSHDKERAEIARAGQHEVLIHHSFDARLNELTLLLAEKEVASG